jgi:hypothetical protein
MEVLWRNPMNARRSRPKSFRTYRDCDIVAEAALEGYRGYPPRTKGREREWSTGHASMRCWAKPACFLKVAVVLTQGVANAKRARRTRYWLVITC